MSSIAEVERLIKDCTGEYVVSADWSAFMRIWELLNANPGRVKPILKPLVKQLGKKSPHTQMLSLQLLDSVVKNCPCSYAYVGSKDVQDAVVKIALGKKKDLRVVNKALGLIKCWHESFSDAAAFPRDRYLFWKSVATVLKADKQFPPDDDEMACPLFTPQVHVPPARSRSPPLPAERPAGTRLAPERGGGGGGGSASPPHSRHHDPVPFLPPEVARGASLSDSELLQTSSESAKLLLSLLESDDTNDDEPSDVVREMYERCERVHSQQMPDLIARVLDRNDEAQLAAALAVQDELERAVAAYKNRGKGALRQRAPSAPRLEVESDNHLQYSPEQSESDDYQALAAPTERAHAAATADFDDFFAERLAKRESDGGGRGAASSSAAAAAVAPAAPTSGKKKKKKPKQAADDGGIVQTGDLIDLDF